MKHADISRRVMLTAIIGATFCIPVVAQPDCVYPADDVTGRGAIQCMALDQLLGVLLLFGFLIALIGVGLVRYRAISSAVKQSRAYESRVLSALFYDCVDEAISVAALFPKSPLAVVVDESIRTGNRLEKVNESRWALHRAIVSQATVLKETALDIGGDRLDFTAGRARHGCVVVGSLQRRSATNTMLRTDHRHSGNLGTPRSLGRG